MSGPTYRQALTLIPTDGQPPQMFGTHQIAVSDTPQQWNFPLIYEYQGVLASVAGINIDGQVTPLQIGYQQISGSGKIVTLIWNMEDGASIKFSSNPWNIEGTLDGYTNKDNPISASDFSFQLSAAATSTSWSIDVNVEFKDGASAQQMLLVVDQSAVADLPAGQSSYQYQGFSVGLYIGGLSGDGVKIAYTLTSSQAETPASLDASPAVSA